MLNVRALVNVSWLWRVTVKEVMAKESRSSGNSCRRARRPVNMLFATAVATIAVAISSGPAFAAGAPYSPVPILPPGISGGFAGVLIAFTVSNVGKVIQTTTTENGSHVSLRLVIPVGTAPSGEEVVVVKPTLSLITPSDYRRVPKSVRKDRVLFALGVLFQKNQHAIADEKSVTLDLSCELFSRADYVVVYSSAAHGFVPVPAPELATLVKGHLALRFRVGTELAVLAR
jgi:hypothetical protein